MRLSETLSRVLRAAAAFAMAAWSISVAAQESREVGQEVELDYAVDDRFHLPLRYERYQPEPDQEEVPEFTMGPEPARFGGMSRSIVESPAAGDTPSVDVDPPTIEPDGLDLDYQPGYSDDRFEVRVPYGRTPEPQPEPESPWGFQPELVDSEEEEYVAYGSDDSGSGRPDTPVYSDDACCLEVPPEQPRGDGPQYEYTGIGEPWDSHARLLRAQDARRLARREYESVARTHRDAGHELSVLEMWGSLRHPEDVEYAEAEYQHTGRHFDDANNALTEAEIEEDEARVANDRAVEDFDAWERRQPTREFPPYEGQPRDPLPRERNAELP